ncbi:MAG: asparaginase [Actinomycetes bacterium]
MTAPADPPPVSPEVPVLAEVVRSGFVESRHRGSVVGLDARGAATLVLGDVETPVFPRSSNKPAQAVGMVRAGLDLGAELLALAAGSHSGEAVHLDGVRKILAGAGLDETALQTPPERPLDDRAYEAAVASGAPRTRLRHNCSGKHAAMLATCVVRDWPLDTYLSPEHPLQVEIRQTFEELTGEFVAATGVDGCGAPLYACSLTGLARAFRVCVLAVPGTPERRVADAMRAHPEYVGGTGREATLLMAAVPGLVAKDGAEGVYAVALDDGRVVALKIEDGGARPRAVVMSAALRQMGLDSPALDTLGRVPVLGHGEPVGRVRAVGLP